MITRTIHADKAAILAELREQKHYMEARIQTPGLTKVKAAGYRGEAMGLAWALGLIEAWVEADSIVVDDGEEVGINTHIRSGD